MPLMPETDNPAAAIAAGLLTGSGMCIVCVCGAKVTEDRRAGLLRRRIPVSAACGGGEGEAVAEVDAAAMAAAEAEAPPASSMDLALGIEREACEGLPA